MKIKVNSESRKVRKVFFRSEEERAALISAVLKAQGLNSQLDQYTIKSEIEETQESRVVCAVHNIYGVKVVIKSIPAEYYHAKAARFAISEAEA